MNEAVSRCLRHGVRVGAHPSYPDREGFGRRELSIGLEWLAGSVRSQCESLRRIAEAKGAKVTAVKPHGALYHAANRDPALARVVIEASLAALGRDIHFFGPPRGALREAARGAGIGYWREGFADRGLAPDGSLLPRGKPGALLDSLEKAAAQARRLVRLGDVETLCVHGDTPGAVEIAKAVRAALDGPPPLLSPFGESAWRFELPAGVDRRSLLRALRAVPGVADVSFGEREGMVAFSTTTANADDAAAGVEAALLGWSAAAPVERPAPKRVRVRYDGEDLAEVADRCGLTVDDVVTLHEARTYEVTTVGFLPGFAYLHGLDPRLALPRRTTPRPRVPPGSVAIAERMTAVYPFASPGGWHLIGTVVDFRAFDPEQGSALEPGDLVRFERVG